MARDGLTRRQLLGRGAVVTASVAGRPAAGGAGSACRRPAAPATTSGSEAPAATTSGSEAPAATADDTRGVLHFVSRPDLTPPALTIAHHGRAATGASDPPYFILTPSGYPLIGPGTPGLMI